ncbi:MAG TPA: signal peptidase I [Pseudobacteroides sp.]|uniref:signal peptidase I n=1 Tax=Pseudobacteroides sp. TaxID=1968840 RepID=UPI002F95749C
MENNQDYNEEKSKIDESGENMPAVKNVIQWIGIIILALFISLLVRGYVFEFVTVDGPSMQNTMFSGQRLIVYKLGYSISFPERGDIVVFKHKEGTGSVIPFADKIPVVRDIIPKQGEEDYIKRVIAVPGDRVDIRDGAIYINQNRLSEPYAIGRTYVYQGLEFPIDSIPEGKLFVVGDNREMSSDSRMIGLIDIDQVKGKAVYRIYPMDKMGILK